MNLRLNPRTAAHVVGDRPLRLQARSFASRRSWRPLNLLDDDSRLASRVLKLLEEGPDARVDGFTRDETLLLWRHGLLISPEERDPREPSASPRPEITREEDGPAWAPPDEAGARLIRRMYPDMSPFFDAPPRSRPTPRDIALWGRGFAFEKQLALPGLLGQGEATMLASYYRRLIESDLLISFAEPSRLTINNDPVGRVLLRRLAPTIQGIVGRPIEDSYTFAAEYMAGGVLEMHTDRLQCEYTVSLLIDYDPLPSDGRSPWPLEIASPGGDQPIRYFQAPGDGVLFKGREAPHGRPRLPDRDRCLILMLHYVDADLPAEDRDLS